jgi:hypothetical protein
VKAAIEIINELGGKGYISEPRVAAIIAKHHASIVTEPGHVQDWAARAGAYIRESGPVSAHRVAAIVAFFAEPLVKLLEEARRSHDRGYNDESSDYPPCPKSDEDALHDARCTCSADAWNARIDEVLK